MAIEGLSYSREFKLSKRIDTANSSFSVGAVKVEIRLAKATPSDAWNSLEACEDNGSAASCLKYPSSARKPIDSGQLNQVLAQDTDPEPQGEAAINALFQKIYADASEDTRRAMMKSFVESNGTVLSTNWDEVGSKSIEPVPPKMS